MAGAVAAVSLLCDEQGPDEQASLMSRDPKDTLNDFFYKNTKKGQISGNYMIYRILNR
jgi:hypothetical protein